MPPAPGVANNVVAEPIINRATCRRGSEIPVSIYTARIGEMRPIHDGGDNLRATELRIVRAAL